MKVFICYLEIYDKGGYPLLLDGTGQHRSSTGSPISSMNSIRIFLLCFI